MELLIKLEPQITETKSLRTVDLDQTEISDDVRLYIALEAVP